MQHNDTDSLDNNIPSNMQALLAEAQRMQQRLQETQENIQSYSIQYETGGGLVKVVMDGRYHILSINISPEIINADDQIILQEAITAAINGAVEIIQEYSRTELEKVTGGISIPGLF